MLRHTAHTSSVMEGDRLTSPDVFWGERRQRRSPQRRALRGRWALAAWKGGMSPRLRPVLTVCRFLQRRGEFIEVRGHVMRKKTGVAC